MHSNTFPKRGIHSLGVSFLIPLNYQKYTSTLADVTSDMGELIQTVCQILPKLGKHLSNINIHVFFSF